MKATLPLLLALVTITSLPCFGNLRPDSSTAGQLTNNRPEGGTLRGETVYADVGPDQTRIDAVFDVSGFPRSADGVLLPVFAAADDDPNAVFLSADVHASLNGSELTRVSLAAAPGGGPAVPAELRIVWVRIEVDALAQRGVGYEANFTLKVSYRQRHINGRFFYLPQSIPDRPGSRAGRNWRYCLFARAGKGSIAFSGSDDWERLGDVLVIYLKTDQIVSLETK